MHWSLVVPVSTPVSTFYLCLQKCWCSLNQQLIYWVKSVKTVEQWEANIINPSWGQEEKIFVKKIVTRFLDFSSVQCPTLTWSHSDTMVSCHHQTLSSRIRTKIVDIWYRIAHWEITGGDKKNMLMLTHSCHSAHGHGNRWDCSCSCLKFLRKYLIHVEEKGKDPTSTLQDQSIVNWEPGATLLTVPT